MLVTMATLISAHVKGKDTIFTARDEDMILLVEGKILVFHQYLNNKCRLNTAYRVGILRSLDRQIRDMTLRSY